jgi:hypothetical protein
LVGDNIVKRHFGKRHFVTFLKETFCRKTFCCETIYRCTNFLFENIPSGNPAAQSQRDEGILVPNETFRMHNTF